MYKGIFVSSTAKVTKPLCFHLSLVGMWEKYRRKTGITKPRFFKLLTVIGELKTVPFSLFETVNHPTVKKVFTQPMIDSLVTDSVLEMTESGNLKLAGKALELFKYYNLPYKHFVRNPYDSNEPHQVELKAFLYPLMFAADYHKVFYPSFKDKHHLEPDAGLILKNDIGYQIKFIEIERTEKGKDYLLDKRAKYVSLGADIYTWESKWKSMHKDLELPYCTKEQFCFSVLCKGKKSFEWEGWEWTP